MGDDPIEQIHVEPNKLISELLKRWDGLSQKNLEALAVQFASLPAKTEAAEDRNYKDAHLIGSLAVCKLVENASDAESLADLYREAEDGGDRPFAGWANAEESKHFERVKKFIDKVFAAKAVQLVDDEFDRLATNALKGKTAEDRIDALQDASDAIGSILQSFDFDDVEDAVQNKQSLFEQLVEAEGGK